jgi:hypothetical protein
MHKLVSGFVLGSSFNMLSGARNVASAAASDIEKVGTGLAHYHNHTSQHCCSCVLSRMPHALYLCLVELMM